MLTLQHKELYFMLLVLSCLRLGRQQSMEQNAIMYTKSEGLDLIAQHQYSS